ncbi:prepilin-type N-terminal cleavage/methylation domain-containing protein [Massilia sp. Mn16-1_5]|uniref:type IV pilus modification PilV family protein n=1 Tax=Massilia sp. Mn16-1_5 TaxID=2079199 RepID=UPI00109E576A|nr:type II secretion system protein [Massilia sp. Mn16-1_5]THC46538.1 MSHA biogenesis protein MshD [Massilia sp. Mn16-1_5]
MSIERERGTTLVRQRGVTLVELIMFIVIVSIALAGILQVMRMTTANSADPLRRKQALLIAEALLEEVRQAGFTYCDPRSGNAAEAQKSADCELAEGWGNEGGKPYLRPYDNVNDYAGAAATATAAFDNDSGALTDALGRPLNLAGYSASVSIVPDALGDIAASGTDADSEALRIRIVVKYDSTESVVLDGYRARYAPQAGVQ